MIKKSFMKKPGAVLLAASLAIGSIAYTPAVTQAANEVSLVSDANSAKANTEMSYDFAVADSNTVYIDVFVPEMVSGTMSLARNGEQVNNEILNSDASTWEYIDNKTFAAYGIKYGYTYVLEKPTPADWNVSLNFDTDTVYAIIISQEKNLASINKNSLTLTAGFSDKLSVKGANGTVKWKSSNNKVATVSSDGKVTSKKAGSAKITATTESGQSLTCAVSVLKNEFNQNRVYPSSVKYGESIMQVYKMSYDKKGNLVLKTSLLNNSGKRSGGIDNVTIIIRSDKGKKIGTFKLKSKRFSLDSGNSKDFTFKIKKADLKIKKANLRTAQYDDPKGTILYWR